MNQRQGVLAACGGVLLTFLAVQFGALALVGPFRRAGYQTVADPQNPANSALYLGVILVATAAILVALRYGGDQILRAFILLTGAMITVYVFAVLPGVGLAGVNIVPWAAAAILLTGLIAYPEWWVIDLAGVVIGVGSAALFGISFGLLPAVLLLAALAVYDAISVYGTEHMLTLASGVVTLRVPVLLVFPTTAGFSYRERAATVDGESGSDGEDDGEISTSTSEGASPASESAETSDESGDRDSIMIGLGDAVMPTIMAASAAVFLPASVPTVAGVPVPALTAVVGTTAGLLVLLRMVLAGRPHAGLPLLNGGAILGYLVGALASGLSVIAALGLAPYL